MTDMIQALLIHCSKNHEKHASYTHDFLACHGANILSESSSRHRSTFTQNILFEADAASLLEIFATYEQDLGAKACGFRPQIVPLETDLARYAGGFLGQIDCYAYDRPGIAAALTGAVRDHADVYQMVSYRTEAAMEGTPLFVAKLKVHVENASHRDELDASMSRLADQGLDIQTSYRAIQVAQQPSPSTAGLLPTTSKKRKDAA